MRALLFLALSASLTACVDTSETEPYALRATSSAPDSLLARLDARALDDAFARLAEAGYTAEVWVESEPSDRAPSDGSRYRQTVEVNGDQVRILSETGPGAPAADRRPFAVFDPVARLLPKEPPFRTGATREMYTLTQATPRPSMPSTVARAAAERVEGSDPIRLATVSVDTTSGRVVSAYVERRSRSAVFDETSKASVRLTRRGATWWPSTGWIWASTDVPLAEGRAERLRWRVLTVGGHPLAADTSAQGQ